jgi:methyl-accepting chemotaxis protein
MLKNLKVGTKLALGFAVVLALSATLGIVAILRMHEANDLATNLSNATAPMVEAANRVERNSLLTMYAMRRYGLTDEAEYLQTAKQHMTQIKEALDECLEIARASGNKKLDEDARTCRESVDRYQDLMDSTVTSLAAIADARQKMDISGAEFIKACDQFLTSQDAKLKEEVNGKEAEAAVLERIGKLALMNEIIDLGNGIRVGNFKSQALRDVELCKKAMENFAAITDRCQSLRKVTRLDADLRAIDAVEAAALGYKKAMESLLSSWTQNEQIAKDRRVAGDRVLELAKTTATLGIEATKAGTAESVASLTSASNVMVVGLIVVVLMGMSIAMLISRGLTRPIRMIVDRIKDIAEGEGDLTKRVDLNSRDELGELATWFNAFVTKVHDIVFEVAQATRDVAGAATEIAASSEQMATGMNEQSQQVSQISSAIEEMSASVIEVARKSVEAAQNATESGKVAQEGGTIVGQTVVGMRGINDAVTSSAVSVQELGKRGQQIGQIIEVINDIADQTNLLALNAAIEAARAGEHGRGFAVVADEVRKLADRTTKATEEIAQSIEAIQRETTEAVNRMNTGTQQVQTGVERASHAGQSLELIVTKARSVAEMIQSIAAAAEQQSSASEQISRNIESITAVTRQSSEGAGQAAAAATQLSAKAEQLQSIVGRFRLAKAA